VIKSKYFSESDLQRFVSDSEQEIDLREVQRAEAHRMQAITDFIANPANKHILDADPMVQKIRAHGTPAQPLRSAAPQHLQTSSAPAYKSRAQLEQEKPWLLA
jgi:hypothetical protein